MKERFLEVELWKKNCVYDEEEKKCSFVRWKRRESHQIDKLCAFKAVSYRPKVFVKYTQKPSFQFVSLFIINVKFHQMIEESVVGLRNNCCRKQHSCAEEGRKKGVVVSSM